MGKLLQKIGDGCLHQSLHGNPGEEKNSILLGMIIIIDKCIEIIFLSDNYLLAMNGCINVKILVFKFYGIKNKLSYYLISNTNQETNMLLILTYLNLFRFQLKNQTSL